MHLVHTYIATGCEIFVSVFVVYGVCSVTDTNTCVLHNARGGGGEGGGEHEAEHGRSSRPTLP